MHLLGVREENGWALSTWDLTYPIGWSHIQKAVYSVYDFYEKPEVLVRYGDDECFEVKEKKIILEVPEDKNMVIRGFSTIIKVPVMIVFYNQLKMVNLKVKQINDEFKNTNYEKFNHSLCEYLDSIELAMYRYKIEGKALVEIA